MPIAKKQSEILINCRVTAISEAGALTAANLDVQLDDFCVNGVDQRLSTLNAGQVTTLKNAIEAIHNTLKGIS